MADETGNAKTQNSAVEEELFDVVIPPGVPRKIIIDIARKFDVDVVECRQKLYFANMDGDERDLLAFRAKRDVAEKVEKCLVEEVRKFIGS
ncbi:conserved hypothetical protein [Methanoregula boonei 6A8]|jgi:hypothetical protein|uniref:Uncharacterized protein n=1 Tax=Methanoregula boonei (strain DSM 21154 / JCM 14090 / 6A8) TaxID=456442 RepID=A7I6J5_METB6|nr:hypothetical protein [Methanoregula boonei]ABS55356.1 conserved hypothetical protein [Methanoregula boonei 6A8]